MGEFVWQEASGLQSYITIGFLELVHSMTFCRHQLLNAYSPENRFLKSECVIHREICQGLRNRTDGKLESVVNHGVTNPSNS